MAGGSGREARDRGEVANRYLVRMAALAPSVHNTQPWYFTASQGTLCLYADQERGLPAEDPAGRELVISCGAALANLTLSMRHLGFAADVSLLPDVSRSGLLARVRWGRHVTATPHEDLLYRSITRRHTRRGPFTGDVPPLVIDELMRVARQERADLYVVYGESRRQHLADLVRDAELAHRGSPVVAAERARWARLAEDGRPDGVAPVPGTATRWNGPEFLDRDFSRDGGQDAWEVWRPDEASVPGLVALVTTRDDRRPGWLAAGQALQRVLLHATGRGVGVAFHTQPLEVPALRERIRAEFTGRDYPQVLLRIGCGGTFAATPRRLVRDVLRAQAADGTQAA